MPNQAGSWSSWATLSPCSAATGDTICVADRTEPPPEVTLPLQHVPGSNPGKSVLLGSSWRVEKCNCHTISFFLIHVLTQVKVVLFKDQSEQKIGHPTVCECVSEGDRELCGDHWKEVSGQTSEVASCQLEDRVTALLFWKNGSPPPAISWMDKNAPVN